MNDKLLLTQNKFLTISDPEGYDLYQLFNDSINKDNNESQKIPKIVLGDLLDSTLIGTLTEDIIPYKSFNIRNLASVLIDENLYSIMGNRDLNKIKCFKLLKLKSKDGKIVNINDLNSNNETSSNTLFNIANTLSNNLKNNDEYEWFVPSLSEGNKWAPIWNIENKKYKSEEWEIGRGSVNFEHKEENEKKQTKEKTPCYNRFNAIFGKDPEVGTMSAQNLLETIPYELKELKLISDTEYTEIKGNQEIKASLVLVVFHIMLLDDDTNSNLNNFEFTLLKYNTNISLKGLLRKFYLSNKTYVSYAEDKNNNLYLLSHGGISNNFLENSSRLGGNFYYFTIDESDNLIVAKLDDGPKLSGGFTIKTSNYYNVDDIMRYVNNFNLFLKNQLEGIFKIDSSETLKPNSYELTILAYTANIKYNIGNNKYDSASLTPIITGFEKLRKLSVITDKKIFNIFGHKPDSFGSVIDIIYNNKGELKGYNINCDISNTLLGNPSICDINNKNYSYLEFNLEKNDEPEIYSKININLKEKVFYDAINIKSNKFLDFKKLESDPNFNLLSFNEVILQKYQEELSNIYKNNYSYIGKFIHIINNKSIIFFLFSNLEGFNVKLYLIYGNLQEAGKKTKKLNKKKTIRKTIRKKKIRRVMKLKKKHKKK